MMLKIKRKLTIRKTARLVAAAYPCVGNWKSFGKLGNFITIDPGLDGTGWAIFPRDTHDYLVPPIASGSIDSPEDVPWSVRALRIAEHLRIVCNSNSVMHAYLELPHFIESPTGIVTARSGKLVQLTTIFGMLSFAAMYAGESSTVSFVRIIDWKGNLPKDICEQRVLNKLKEFKWRPRTNTSHEMDAVGLGLYVKGHFG